MRRIQPRKLLVEGQTDKRVIPYLMEANGIAWEDSTGQPTVTIKPMDGVEEILKPGAVEAELAATGLEALGVIVDANGDAHKRWNQLRRHCDSAIPGLPEVLPEGGVITAGRQNPAGRNIPRFGVWIMPDNRLTGMLEDFLLQFVRNDSKELLDLAHHCTKEAKNQGAPYKSPHFAKARLHTWLAWQDEPGKQLHEAVHHRLLDPTKPQCQPFVEWFRALFSV